MIVGEPSQSGPPLSFSEDLFSRFQKWCLAASLPLVTGFEQFLGAFSKFDWLRDARSHPESALAELRRQIEKQIKRVALRYDPQAEKKRLFDLIDMLKDKG